MAILNAKEELEIDSLTRRIAYDYAIACESGNENWQMAAVTKFEMLANIMSIIGVERLPTFLKDNMLLIGRQLYRDGYRKEGEMLVKRNNRVENVI